MDPRSTLIHDASADLALEGIVAATQYLAPRPRQLVVASTGLCGTPEDAAEQRDQLLFGERFDLLESRDGWGFGQARRDGYVGWVVLDALAEMRGEPTHWVSALRTYGFSAPSIKTAPTMQLSMNALVTVEAREGRFARAVGAGWIADSHLSPLGQWAEDPAAVAERYLGAPYLWGGRDGLGLDCSGLVQQAGYACGFAWPRDSDQQAALGRAVARAELKRGDLAFWRGHVGMMLDGDRLLHANAHHMAVAIEPLDVAAGRIEAAGGGQPTGFRRPDLCG